MAVINGGGTPQGLAQNQPPKADVASEIVCDFKLACGVLAERIVIQTDDEIWDGAQQVLNVDVNEVRLFLSRRFNLDTVRSIAKHLDGKIPGLCAIPQNTNGLQYIALVMNKPGGAIEASLTEHMTVLNIYVSWTKTDVSVPYGVLEKFKVYLPTLPDAPDHEHR